MRFLYLLFCLLPSIWSVSISKGASKKSAAIPEIQEAVTEIDGNFWKETLIAFLETKRYDRFKEALQLPEVLSLLSNDQFTAIVLEAEKNPFLLKAIVPFLLKQGVRSRISSITWGSVLNVLVESHHYGASTRVIIEISTEIPKSSLEGAVKQYLKSLEKRKLLPPWAKDTLLPDTGIVFRFQGS